jgi:hypothetical protein
MSQAHMSGVIVFCSCDCLTRTHLCHQCHGHGLQTVLYLECLPQMRCYVHCDLVQHGMFCPDWRTCGMLADARGLFIEPMTFSSIKLGGSNLTIYRDLPLVCSYLNQDTSKSVFHARISVNLLISHCIGFIFVLLIVRRLFKLLIAVCMHVNCRWPQDKEEVFVVSDILYDACIGGGSAVFSFGELEAYFVSNQTKCTDNKIKFSKYVLYTEYIVSTEYNGFYACDIPFDILLNYESLSLQKDSFFIMFVLYHAAKRHS